MTTENDEMRDYRIAISVEANTREQAIEIIEKKLSWLRDGGWAETLDPGGYHSADDGAVYKLVIGPSNFHDIPILNTKPEA